MILVAAADDDKCNIAHLAASASDIPTMWQQSERIMCGRYTLYGPVSRLRKHFDAEIAGFDFEPRYNAAPMQWLPVIRQRPSGERIIHRLRWGLVPSWAKDEVIATKLINARGETVADKPSFRAAFRKRRCIVPANGFFEWKAVAGKKQPYFIHLANDDLIGLAGLWERWTRPTDGEEIDTFTIVTTEANATVAPVHDRMPVILSPADYGAWLDAGTDIEEVTRLLRPSPEGVLEMHPVATDVGNVRNDNASLIVRISI